MYNKSLGSFRRIVLRWSLTAVYSEYILVASAGNFLFAAHYRFYQKRLKARILSTGRVESTSYLFDGFRQRSL